MKNLLCKTYRAETSKYVVSYILVLTTKHACNDATINQEFVINMHSLMTDAQITNVSPEVIC